MSMKTNNIQNKTENFTHKQKQGFYCQTSNFYCSMPEIKKDISTIDSKLKPLYDFLQGTRLISLNLIINVSYLLGEDEELVKNAICISFYDKKTCKSLEFLHQVGFVNILYGIRDINEFLEDENNYKKVGDYLDSIYVHLTEFITMFERDIDNYEIHIVPKEGIKETVVKQFENVEYKVEKHIFEYVVKLYDLIINVENNFFDKERDKTYKNQVLEALSKTCKFIASKISLNEHLEGFFSCSKIVQFEGKTQKKPAEQVIKIKGGNTFYLQQLNDNTVSNGNNLTLIGGESKNQTPVSTEIMVIGVSFVIVSFLFGIIYLVYNYFMKKRELKERRQCSDRIELVVHCDADDIELN